MDTPFQNLELELFTDEAVSSRMDNAKQAAHNDNGCRQERLSPATRVVSTTG